MDAFGALAVAVGFGCFVVALLALVESAFFVPQIALAEAVWLVLSHRTTWVISIDDWAWR